ncbi:hypothetical protein CRG98_026205 [Punica granatum]|uniref:Pentatricopeptide repeat-containing protein At4g38150-like n=1 Tax=Punica granatum TaxID=22663 RepID=A0A2I0JCM4_PUNGR|nr:hypothetical protein CRG98_026205 [Punica granatum]
MAVAALSRSLDFSHHRLPRFALSRLIPYSSSRFNFLASHFPTHPAITVPLSGTSSVAITAPSKSKGFVWLRRLSTANPGDDPKPKRRNTKVNFSLSDSDSDAEDDGSEKAEETKLPPPYDPFNKKPVVEEPEDPKNLQEIFHKMRTEGLTNHAVKMFDALSKDGRTHEALELFAQIKDRGHMPDVVAHTAVIEAYANAGGQSKDALKVFMRMLASGVKPNAYTYAVLIRGLAGDGKLGEVKKYVMEMIGKEIMPNPGTCVSLFEAFVREGQEEEGRELLEEMKRKGFVPEEKGVREVLRSMRGPVVRSVMDILFGK